MYILFTVISTQTFKICWVTSLVNTDSSNYKEGLSKGYFLNRGETVKWWHGHGTFRFFSFYIINQLFNKNLIINNF